MCVFVCLCLRLCVYVSVCVCVCVCTCLCWQIIGKNESGDTTGRAALNRCYPRHPVLFYDGWCCCSCFSGWWLRHRGQQSGSDRRTSLVPRCDG